MSSKSLLPMLPVGLPGALMEISSLYEPRSQDPTPLASKLIGPLAGTGLLSSAATLPDLRFRQLTLISIWGHGFFTTKETNSFSVGRIRSTSVPTAPSDPMSRPIRNLSIDGSTFADDAGGAVGSAFASAPGDAASGLPPASGLGASFFFPPPQATSAATTIIGTTVLANRIASHHKTRSSPPHGDPARAANIAVRVRPQAPALRLTARLALVAGSLLVTLALCEAGARVLLRPPQTIRMKDTGAPPGAFEHLETREPDGHIDQLLLWDGPLGLRLRPNTRAEVTRHAVSQRDVVIETSSLGLRSAELGPKAPDEVRVLVLGDSITFGDFVEANETFTARMEALTAGRPRRIRFVNAGLPGVGTVEEYYLYQELQAKVQPDVVLVGMYLNDSQTAGAFYARGLKEPWSRSRFLAWAASSVQLLQKKLYTERKIGEIDPAWKEEFRAGRELKSGDMANDRDAFDFEVYNAHADFGLAWNPKSWRIIEDVLTPFADATAARKQRLAVVLFPIHIQVIGTYRDDRPQTWAREMCARVGVPFLDLVPALRADRQEGRRQEPRLYYDHCHYTPYGYGVVAKATVDWLTEQKLIP